MNETCDPASIALPHEHGAFVRQVIEDARGWPELLLLLSDFYTELSKHLAAGGLARAADHAAACAIRLSDAVRPNPPELCPGRLRRLVTFIKQRFT